MEDRRATGHTRTLLREHHGVHNKVFDTIHDHIEPLFMTLLTGGKLNAKSSRRHINRLWNKLPKERILHASLGPTEIALFGHFEAREDDEGNITSMKRLRSRLRGVVDIVVANRKYGKHITAVVPFVYSEHFLERYYTRTSYSSLENHYEEMILMGKLMTRYSRVYGNNNGVVFPINGGLVLGNMLGKLSDVSEEDAKQPSFIADKYKLVPSQYMMSHFEKNITKEEGYLETTCNPVQRGVHFTTFIDKSLFRPSQEYIYREMKEFYAEMRESLALFFVLEYIGGDSSVIEHDLLSQFDLKFANMWRECVKEAEYDNPQYY